MKRRRVALAALCLLLLEVAGLVVQRGYAHEAFVAIVLLQGVAYLACVLWLGEVRSVAVVLAFAALLRVGPLLGPVIWSSDVNRYVWDGWVQRAGINPYCCVPADPRLDFLRDGAVYPQINRRETAPTIYPPVAQFVFAANAFLGGSVLSMKALLVGFEALGAVAMLGVLRRSGQPAARVLIYAWHPLPVWEIAGSGHVDALAVAFVPLALWAALADRRVLAGIAFAAAVLTKFFPLVLAPALWRSGTSRLGDWRLPAAAAGTAVLCYLPYLAVGSRVLGYLPGYTQEEQLASGSGFWLVDALGAAGVTLPAGAYLALVALVMAGLAVLALRDGRMLRWAAVLAIAAVVGFSPHYAWYFVWPLVTLALAPQPGAFLLPALWPSLTAVLLYWDPVGGRVPVWVGAIIYGGFAATTAAAALIRRHRGERHVVGTAG